MSTHHPSAAFPVDGPVARVETAPAAVAPAPAIATQPALGAPTHPNLGLFGCGFVILFLELACIRWFAAHVVFLQFFTNIILMACFLGMSIGCLCARSRTHWLGRFPSLLLGCVVAAVVVDGVYSYWSGIAVGVGDAAAIDVVFFGTETRHPDLARFVIPIEVLAGLFFLLITLAFIGPGQLLGRCFEACPHRVGGYTWNIAGSLVGIAAFAAVSFLSLPPLVWFAVALAAAAGLLRLARALQWSHVAALATCVAVVGTADHLLARDKQVQWSPYYMVHYEPESQTIGANMISHQTMMPTAHPGQGYAIMYRMWRDAGQTPFDNALIIGAGSGNDVAHALEAGVPHIDAVEIDPVILDFGRRLHPDRPYDDPRVHAHLDDGRHFLRTAQQPYDLVVFALVDSLILHSSYSNVRLESFLFTEEAFRDVRHALADDGVFVMYNFFRQGWIVHRISAMLERVFGRPPLVFSLPHVPEIGANDALDTNLTMIIAGNTAALEARFAEQHTYWFDKHAADQPDGFAARTAGDDRWAPIAPATLRADGPTPIPSTDDWPFLYHREPAVSSMYVRSILLIGGLGIGLLFLLAPGHRVALDRRMFFLGAAFMLLETRAVVQLALLFGSTWIVNSAVFFTILLMILAANLYVLRTTGIQLKRHYAGLLICLGVYYATPMDLFLDGGAVWRYAVPCTLAMLPMFFAGVVFAVSFRESRQADQAFAANIAGSVVGGLAEYLSMLVGFGHLLGLAAGFYLLSALARRARPGAAG